MLNAPVPEATMFKKPLATEALVRKSTNRPTPSNA